MTMHALRFTFTLSLLALPLAACGDDGGGTSDASVTQGGSTGNGGSTGQSGSTGVDATSNVTTDATDPSATDPTTAGPTTASPSTGDVSTTDATTGVDTTGENTTAPQTTGDTTGGGNGLSWEKDVYPAIVEGTCSCHAGGSGGLTMTSAMDSYMNIVNVDATQVGFLRVAPGDPTNSYFLAKVAGTAGMPPFNSGSPSQMPKVGAPKGQKAIDLLTQWIAEGANP